MKKSTVKNTLLIVGLMVIGTIMGITAAIYQQRQAAPVPPPGVFWPSPKQIQPFTLIDHTGAKFDLNRIKGKWSFLFFGFTHCPDVCPITLSVLNQVHMKLKTTGIAKDIQTLFITVDPGRDTPEQLAQYVGYFNAEFIGLGGTNAQISSLTSQIGVVFMYGAGETDGSYSVDHSASIFLTDPKGRLVSIFSMPHNADEITRKYVDIMKFINQEAG